jgi:hypothetical protein
VTIDVHQDLLRSQNGSEVRKGIRGKSAEGMEAMQHVIGNILIEIDGNAANVESPLIYLVVDAIEKEGADDQGLSHSAVRGGGIREDGPGLP